MTITEYILFILLICSQVGCDKNKERVRANQEKISFVISCGSGCALTYDLKQVDHNDKLVLNFHIRMYINENLEEVYNDTFIIRNIADEITIEKGGVFLSEESHGELFVRLMEVYRKIIQ